MRNNMNESLRDKVINEIISTEKTYIQQLQTLSEYFAKPAYEKGLLPLHIHTAIFGELPSLQHMNEELYQALSSEDGDVGVAFLHLAPFLKVYSSYAKNYQQAINLLLEWERKSERLRSWLAGTETRPEVQAKLPSLLITPVQRVPRYRLLLGELLKYTPRDHPEYSKIAKSVEEVCQVAKHIDCSISKAENLKRMLIIQRALRYDQPSIIAPGRQLLKEGVLQKVSRNGNSSQARLFLLFTDILMYTKLPSVGLLSSSNTSAAETVDFDYKPRSLDCCCVLPLRHCSVIPILGNDQKGLFRIKCESEDMLLYNADEVSGGSWITTLKDAIQDAVDKRKTLRKDSSSRKPMRRPALRKLTIKGDPEQLIALKVTKHQDENAANTSLSSDTPGLDSPKSPKINTTPKKRPRSPGSVMSQLLQVQDCLTPPRSWLSPKKKKHVSSSSSTDDETKNEIQRPASVPERRIRDSKRSRRPVSHKESNVNMARYRVEVASRTRTPPSRPFSYSPHRRTQYVPSPLAKE